ncbi:MAG: thiazole synthase [Verrucomicrobia bacterium]|nr:thiazole synthase [Verrucomicrobiota bacterium]
MFDLYGKTCASHLILGSAGFTSPDTLIEAIEAAAVELVTVNLPAPDSGYVLDDLNWDWLEAVSVDIMPATLGCRTAQEAIQVASEAREALNTDRIKLQIDDPTNPDALFAAARQLVSSGFKVLPVIPPELDIARRFVDAGCSALMPTGSPPGSGQGPGSFERLARLRDGLDDVTLIVTGGIGRPSHAAQIMELGFDAVHIVSAIARAGDPVGMAEAFANAVDAGLSGYTAGLMEPEPASAEDDNQFWDL